MTTGMASHLVRRALVQTVRLNHPTKILQLAPHIGLKSLRCICISTKLHAKRYFTEKHEWVDVKNGEGVVGITDYAQEKLGEVVYAQLSEVGTEIQQNDEIGVIESVKAASEVYSPVSGEVIQINQEVCDEPKLINESPYEKGWLVKLKLTNMEELEVLMDKDAYENHVKTLE
ncbi:hypothetical protein KUTeg_019763 [Tegillarca granosa]|uniref:Glycine cleavage system H protein n=1 Tax=Tegillarca granosa TaxID=220873 RepID=A0ABQ9EDI7_TEGGR|nr:hypothetical protein KUTeg_019763 [Tegillarca granosa]